MAARRKKKTSGGGSALMVPMTLADLELPSELQSEFADSINRDLAASKMGGPPFIRTSGPTLTVGGEPVPDPFEVIVMGAIRANNYFEEAYTGETAFPSCYALDLVGDELKMAPPVDLATKQADACKDCPMNAFGSGDTGKGKACANNIKLFLLPWQGDELNYAEVSGAFLNLPPTSAAGWGGYTKPLLIGKRRPLWSVVTRFEKVLNEAGGFRIEPHLVGAIQSPELLRTLQQRAEGDVLEHLRTLPQGGGGGDAPKPRGGGPRGEVRRKVTRRRRKKPAA